MFDDLISFDPDHGVTPVIAAGPADVLPLDKATVQQVVEAQRASAQWLVDLGADDEEEIDAELGRKAARTAFQAVSVGALPQQAKEALMTINSPAAVAHLTGMLTAYDWEFVQQAKELRGYVVARLLEESSPERGGKAPDRIKALVALGKITEVGLFTEKIEVTKKDMSDDELDARIKDRMDRLRRIADALPRPAGANDTPTDVEPK